MDINKLRLKHTLLRGLAIITLAGIGLGGCGGGSDGTPNSDGGIIGTGYLLKGTVASERMLAQNSVEVKAASGERTIASIGNNGRFESGDIQGDSPYLIRVDLGNDNYRYSIGHLNGETITQNLHSYTDAATRNWFAQNNQNVDSVFNSGSAITTLPSEGQYTEIFNSLTNIVGLVQQDYGLGSVDLATVSFNADDTGVDAYLNQNPVLINNGQITIIINDPASNTQSVAASNLSLNTNLQSADTTPPATPDSVRVLQSAADEVVVVWEPASDDIGIAAYQILRDGVLVDTTPYPVYTDSGLTSGNQYSYSIVAVDAAGNESSATNMQMIALTNDVDTTPPSEPVSLQTNATSTSVALTWQQSGIDDVAQFEVLRGIGNTAPTAVARVSSTFYTDPSVESGTQYCYQVVAIDSSGNRSAASNNQCATTTGNTVVIQPPVNTNVDIAFANTNYSVSENGGSVIVSVSRSGTAATSVDYTVASGTATSGEDFTASSGTLTWTEGDNSPKTITVQINTDSISESDETISVLLSNASGSGVITVSETIITIADVDPVSCTNELSPTRIDENITISSGCYLVEASITVSEGANLTLAPGTTLKFATNTALNVGSGGSLTAEGTAASPILLTGQDQTPGYWNGVRLTFSNSIQNSLDHTTIEYGGSGSDAGNLKLTSTSTSPSRISITNSTFRHSLGYGVSLGANSLLDDFENNTLTQNEEPIKLAPVRVNDLSTSSSFTGNAIDKIYVSGSSFETSANWEKLDAPYSVGNLSLAATLTIQPGVRMEFRSSSELRVSGDGALSAVGTASAPVVFTSTEQTNGFWSGLYFVFSTSPQNKLENVIVEYGGTAGNNDALISLISTESSPSRLSMNNVTLRNSLADGINIGNNSILTQFDNITSTSNTRPIVISTELVTSLGTGLDFTGNQNDFIYVVNGTADEAGAWTNHGVPYSVGTLTINADIAMTAGVQMLMRSTSEIYVSSQGSLNARGTSAQPIVMQGDQAVAGYWSGIKYAFSNNVNNITDNVSISHAGGGRPDRSGAIELVCTSTSPVRLTITNTAITDSGGWGILQDDNCLLTIGSGVTYSNNAQGNLSP